MRIIEKELEDGGADVVKLATMAHHAHHEADVLR